MKKPKQYFDTRSHQLYYQWDESEYFSHQEPIYDRTREYIESLEAENTKLQKLVYDLLNAWDDMQHEVITGPTFDECERCAYELGIEIGNE